MLITRKNLKKISVFFSFLIISSIMIPTYVFANDNLNSEIEVKIDYSNQEKAEILTERKEIVDTIESQIINSDENIDNIILDTLEENNQETLIAPIEEKLINVTNEGEVNLETNIPTETFKINNEMTVTFDDNLIIVDEFIESTETDVEELIDDSYLEKSVSFLDNLFFIKVEAAKKNKRKKASHSRNIYDSMFKKFKIVTAYIGAEFTYNGSKVTARRTGNYMKTVNGSGYAISINSKKSAIQKPSKSRRIAYQSGMATLGIKIKGNKIKFQEKYLRVNVESNAKGKISKSSMLR